jgi:cobalt-zinc-cadmium efflux system outer membrane protein
MMTRAFILPAALMVLLSGFVTRLCVADEPSQAPASQASSWQKTEDSDAITVERLEMLALEHNPTLDQARAETWKAYGRYVQAGLYPNPEVGYAASEVGNDGRAGQQGSYIQQEFVFGNKLALSQNIGAAERTAADHALALQELRVRNNVRLEYYSILTATRSRDIAKQLLKVAESAAALAKLRRESGEGNRIDELQARGEQQRAAVTVAQSEYVAAAWKRMLAVVGDPNLTQQQLSGHLEAETLPEITFDELLARLEGNSPQIRLAEARIGRAQAEYARAEVEPIPNLTLQNTIQYDYSTQYTVVGIQATLPIPVFNRNQGTIAAAEQEWIQASRETRRLRLSLQRDLASRWQQFANARVQVERYRDDVLPTVSETLKLTRDAYEAGETDYLRLLTAQRSYTETYREYIEALGIAWQEAIRLNGLLLSDGLAAAESVTN